MRFLIGDGAAQFCRGFDEVFRAEGAEVLVTAVAALHANAYAERWLRSIHAEFFDWLLAVEPRALGAGPPDLHPALQPAASISKSNAGLEPPGPAAGRTLVGEA
jgi:hypothetical protein